MTTVAFDGKTLATDSQGGGNHFAYENGPKYFKDQQGRIYGYTGELQCVPEFKDWLNGGQKDPLPNFAEPEGSRLVVLLASKEGSYLYEDRCIPFKVSTPYAIGTGARFAMAAMMAGADAKRAVEIAIELDIYSGGEVHTIEVSE